MRVRPAALALGPLLALLAACQGRGLTPPAPAGAQPADPLPARRTAGPRLPAPFDGRDPAALGLVKVEGLLWLQQTDVAAWPPGGRGVAADASAGPGAGLTLRTDHALLRTDLGAEQALPLARAAQGHVEALLRTHGEALDLRFPAAPLPVTVFARRTDFERALAARLGRPAGHHAFYDATRAEVLVAAEPHPAAPIPLLADLRHELTHAVLDRSAPRAVSHERLAAGRHLWLWEGVALEAEGRDGLAARLPRAQARLARGELEPLGILFRLPQASFEGRHYDQVAALMAFFATERALEARAQGLLRSLLAGDLDAHAPDPLLGEPEAAIDARFAAWLKGARVGG